MMKKKICGQTCECKTEDDCYFQHISTMKGMEVPEKTVTITLSELQALGYKSPDEVKSIVEKVLERAAEQSSNMRDPRMFLAKDINQRILNINYSDLI